MGDAGLCIFKERLAYNDICATITDTAKPVRLPASGCLHLLRITGNRVCIIAIEGYPAIRNIRAMNCCCKKVIAMILACFSYDIWDPQT